MLNSAPANAAKLLQVLHPGKKKKKKCTSRTSRMPQCRPGYPISELLIARELPLTQRLVPGARRGPRAGFAAPRAGCGWGGAGCAPAPPPALPAPPRALRASEGVPLSHPAFLPLSFQSCPAFCRFFLRVYSFNSSLFSVGSRASLRTALRGSLSFTRVYFCLKT